VPGAPYFEATDETDDDEIEPGVSAWVPITDVVALALLGKLIEECNELSKTAARCIMRGLEDVDEDTSESQGWLLLNELADVQARINDVSRVFNMRDDLIELRAEAKSMFHLKWLRHLKRVFGSRYEP
jgi:hypothetical protein